MEDFLEILAGPITLYLAPVGTAFPAPGAAPAAAWKKVGTGGDENYSEDGVTVTHTQKIDQARTAGRNGPVKAWRTEEDLMITATVLDATLEQYAKALNDATVGTTAAGSGTAGYKSMGLSQGHEVKTHALLAIGKSPEGEDFVAHYEVPRCYQSGNPKPVYKKNAPAGLELEFTALEDRNAASAAERFGRRIVQHQAPLA